MSLTFRVAVERLFKAPLDHSEPPSSHSKQTLFECNKTASRATIARRHHHPGSRFLQKKSDLARKTVTDATRRNTKSGPQDDTF